MILLELEISVSKLLKKYYFCMSVQSITLPDSIMYLHYYMGQRIPKNREACKLCCTRRILKIKSNAICYYRLTLC